ncbi:MAG: hypothetical protein BGO97_01130 [Micrococcales bacterium 70-64]|nr:arginyl-tRNA synthetase [Leifsonia sp.]ODU65823.1 MAG: hypothetical protein ABT06_01130 [Leifsonia sp. SCN 70-46]OJX84450.1 MAG: hypothetical protein BGO97_01130 [Micrococcales bacterium 70-64]
MSSRRALLLAPLLLLALAGCVPGDPGATADPTLPPPPSITPNPTPTITATPGPETEPVTLGCSDLLTPQAVYDYNPNVSLLPSFSPDAASPAGRALAQQGIACSLVNQTSGMTVDFGVVAYTADALAAKKDAVAASSTAAADYDGYFDVIDGVGTAQVFSGSYYLTVTSGEFGSSGDIAPLVAMAVSTLG